MRMHSSVSFSNSPSKTFVYVGMNGTGALKHQPFNIKTLISPHSLCCIDKFPNFLNFTQKISRIFHAVRNNSLQSFGTAIRCSGADHQCSCIGELQHGPFSLNTDVAGCDYSIQSQTAGRNAFANSGSNFCHLLLIGRNQEYRCSQAAKMQSDRILFLNPSATQHPEHPHKKRVHAPSV